jgi:hypothetical protein
MRRARQVAVFLTLLAWHRPGMAGGPLGENGAPIQTSNYAVDLYQGSVFAGSRVTGLAGAYVAIAEDVDGDLQNPAAPAVRPFYSYDHFDYWLGFGLTFPATLENTDFFNSGSQTKLANSPDAFVFVVPSLNLQWGELGIGFTLELSSYQLSSKPAEERQSAAISATIPIFHLQFAHGLSHNQWVLGAGARVASLSVTTGDGDGSFQSTGSGLEFGVLCKPEDLPWRVGLALRTAIHTEAGYSDRLLPDENGDIVISDDAGVQFYMPKSVALPWDLNVGVAVQFGRPFNPPWRPSPELVERQTLIHRLEQIERGERESAELEEAPPERRKEIKIQFMREEAASDAQLAHARSESRRTTERRLAELNRFYVQIAASLIVAGAVEQAVGVESFVSQVTNRSGQKTVFSPRIGTEAGVIPEVLRVRLGSYLEPTRFETSDARLHGTLGLDVRLVNWNVLGLWPDDYVWRLGLGADVSRRYFSWGLTIGGWYPRQRAPE